MIKGIESLGFCLVICKEVEFILILMKSKSDDKVRIVNEERNFLGKLFIFERFEQGFIGENYDDGNFVVRFFLLEIYVVYVLKEGCCM